MTKKQKNVLNRIIIAIVLLIVITVFKTIVPVQAMSSLSSI